MKTVSNYLFEAFKDSVPQLTGVAQSTVNLDIEEPATFDSSSNLVGSFAKTSVLVIRASFYSDKVWSRLPNPDAGSLEIVSWRKVAFPIFPARLEVTLLAKPGKETKEIFDILKDSFK